MTKEDNSNFKDISPVNGGSKVKAISSVESSSKVKDSSVVTHTSRIKDISKLNISKIKDFPNRNEAKKLMIKK